MIILVLALAGIVSCLKKRPVQSIVVISDDNNKQNGNSSNATLKDSLISES
jgi:hypothetical protein